MRHSDALRKLGNGAQSAEMINEQARILGISDRIDRMAVYKWRKRDKIPDNWVLPVAWALEIAPHNLNSRLYPNLGAKIPHN